MQVVRFWSSEVTAGETIGGTGSLISVTTMNPQRDRVHMEAISSINQMGTIIKTGGTQKMAIRIP